MPADYHMHTELTDGVGRPRDYAAVAVQRGLTEIGCSDHAPLNFLPPDQGQGWIMKLSDLDKYVGWVRDAQQEYPQLTIKLGLEVDFIPGHEDWVRQLAAMHPWDFFLGSVHFIGDWHVDRSGEDWKGYDIEERWRAYFDLWTQAAQSRLFDSLAHPDLPKKFGHRPKSDCKPMFERALRAVKESGCAIEISTAGLRKPCREIYPSREFLEIACRLGIPVTLGSDAHLPDDVGKDFNKAIELAKSVGYRESCKFTKRKCSPEKL